MAQFKTNAMRILDKEKIPYSVHTYESDGSAVDGVTVARKIGREEKQVFKTLVTRGSSREYYVFVIPVAETLDLKAAARSVGEKSVEMIKVEDISKITGYVRGGCSPVGMKKEYKTVVDQSCLTLPTMICSAGKIGWQIETAPSCLIGLIHADMADLCEKSENN